MRKILKEYHIKLSISDGVSTPIKEYSFSLLAGDMGAGLEGLIDRLEGIREALNLANGRIKTRC